MGLMERGSNGIVYNTQLGFERNVTGFYGDPRRVFVTGEVRF